MIEILTVFVGIFLAQVSPGPNMMAVATASLGTGRVAGTATALGVATGVFVWCILFSLGIGALLQAFPETVIVMRAIGGGYLLFLGAKSLKNAFATIDGAQYYQHLQISTGAAYRRGLLVVMTNPKAALMWVAISMFLVTSGWGVVEFLAISIGASVSVACVYGLYAVLFSTGVAVRGYQRFFRLIDGSFGVIFGAFGGKLISDAIREMQPS